MKHDRMRSVDIIFDGGALSPCFPNASPRIVRQSRYCDTGLDYPFGIWQGKVRVSLAPFPCLLGDRRPHPPADKRDNQNHGTGTRAQARDDDDDAASAEGEMKNRWKGKHFRIYPGAPIKTMEEEVKGGIAKKDLSVSTLPAPTWRKLKERVCAPTMAPCTLNTAYDAT